MTIAIMASLSLSLFSSSPPFSSMLKGDGGATKMAYAQTSSDTLDQNGIKRLDPINQYSLSYGSEWYTFTKNFRSDGSMRMDFKNRESDSAMLAGYFRIQSSDCTNTPKEEISAKFNGGPHTSSGSSGSTDEPNNTWADTMDMGTSFDLDRARIRWEKTHPTYSSSISPTSTQTPISGTMCSTPDKWIGYLAFKLNLDSNCDGKVDQIRLLQYIDRSGLDNGKPRNNWVLTFDRTFSLNEIGLKSKIQSYVEDIGHPEYRYQTLRIDGQSQSEWQSTTNPPYKFVTLKQITNIQKDDGSCTTEPEPGPEPEPTPSFTTISFANVNQGQTLSDVYRVVVSASPTNTVSNIKLYVDDSTLINTENSAPYEFDLDTADFSDGNHVLKAVATATTSAGGGTVTKTISVVFDNEDTEVPEPEPTPSFTTISFANVNQGQTLSDVYRVVVSASPTNTVSNIKLYVDDSTLINTENSAPYEFDLDTADFSDGNHVLKAVATATTSAGGGTVTKTISVVFDN